MRIDIELDDELYRQACAVTKRRGITFDALMEEALRALLDDLDEKSSSEPRQS